MTYVWEEIWQQDGYADPADRRRRATLRMHAIGKTLRGETNLGRVVELGCGDGSFAECLAAESGWIVTSYLGIDRSTTAVSRANKQPLDKGKYSFEFGDIEDLELPDNSVDTFIALGVLEHVEDPRTVLRRIAVAGSRNARLVVSTSNMLSLMYIDRLVRQARGTWQYGYQKNYTPKQLQLLLSPEFNLEGKLIVQENWRYLASAVLDRIGHMIMGNIGRYIVAVARLNKP